MIPIPMTTEFTLAAGKCREATRRCWNSGGLGAGFGEGEPLVAEVGDDLQAPPKAST